MTNQFWNRIPHWVQPVWLYVRLSGCILKHEPHMAAYTPELGLLSLSSWSVEALLTSSFNSLICWSSCCRWVFRPTSCFCRRDWKTMTKQKMHKAVSLKQASKKRVMQQTDSRTFKGFFSKRREFQCCKLCRKTLEVHNISNHNNPHNINMWVTIWTIGISIFGKIWHFRGHALRPSNPGNTFIKKGKRGLNVAFLKSILLSPCKQWLKLHVFLIRYKV